MKNTKNLILCALFAALTFVTTAYIMHFAIPGGGYVHLGDAIIYLAAVLLPRGWAMAAGAVGAGLCDMMFAPEYVIPTIIIKPMLTLFFTRRGGRILCAQNVAATVFAGVAGLFGYFLFEAFALFNGDFQKSLVAAIPGSIQPLASAAAFIILGFALDKINLKKRI